MKFKRQDQSCRATQWAEIASSAGYLKAQSAPRPCAFLGPTGAAPMKKTLGGNTISTDCGLRPPPRVFHPTNRLMKGGWDNPAACGLGPDDLTRHLSDLVHPVAPGLTCLDSAASALAPATHCRTNDCNSTASNITICVMGMTPRRPRDDDVRLLARHASAVLRGVSLEKDLSTDLPKIPPIEVFRT